jgi:hypothetical protein
MKALVYNEVIERSNTNDKIHEFAEHITTDLLNFCTNMNSCRTKVKFSPKILRVALCLYCQSPSGYRNLKESSLEILPSESLLKKVKGKCNQNDGYILEENSIHFSCSKNLSYVPGYPDILI